MAVIEQEIDSARNRGVENKEIRITAIKPSSLNPRKIFDELALQELADSITAHGILEPIVVRWIEQSGYEIIAGERRWRAAKLAGLEYVPVRILEGVDDRTALEMALTENLARRDIDPIEEAEGLKALQDMGVRTTEIAKKINRDPATISNAVRLLKLPEPIQEHIRKGEISASHGKALIPYVDYPKILEAKLNQSLNGVPSKQIEKLDHDSWKLYQTGAIADVRTAMIGVEAAKECLHCSDRREASGDGWLCLKVPCFNAKKQAQTESAVAEAKAAAGITEDQDIIRTADFKWGEYAQLDEEDIERCTAENCEHRKQALASGLSSFITICTNPSCAQAIRIQAREAEQKARIDEANRKYKEAVAEIQLDSNEEKALVIALYDEISNVEEGVLKEAVERLGLSLDSSKLEDVHELTGQVYEALLCLDSSDLIRLAAVIQLLHEKHNAQWDKSLMTDWLLGIKHDVNVVKCEACGRDFDGDRGYGDKACSWGCSQKIAGKASEDDVPDACMKCEKDECDNCQGTPGPVSEESEESSPSEDESISEVTANPGLVSGENQEDSPQSIIPPLSSTVRVGDTITQRSKNSDEVPYTAELIASSVKVMAIDADLSHIKLGNGNVVSSVVSHEILDKYYRCLLRPDDIAVGDQVSLIDQTWDTGIATVTEKNSTGVRVAYPDKTTSYPTWEVFTRHYQIVKRAEGIAKQNDPTEAESKKESKQNGLSHCGLDRLAVDSARLNHPGDIYRAWSGELLGKMPQKGNPDPDQIQNPFMQNGFEFVVIGRSSEPTGDNRRRESAYAYQIVPIAKWKDTIYASKNDLPLENRPHMHYHGLKVRYKAEDYVLFGPQVEFYADIALPRPSLLDTIGQTEAIEPNPASNEPENPGLESDFIGQDSPTWTVYKRDSNSIAYVILNKNETQPNIYTHNKWITVWLLVTGVISYRLNSKFLPFRATRAEAQADLDAYAQKKKWARYGIIDADGNIQREGNGKQ